MPRAFVAALAASAATAFAVGGRNALAEQPTPNQPHAIEEAVAAKFAELDKDGDGLLSRLECSRMPGLLESFLKFDTDKDGKLNREEFARAAAPLLAANQRR